MTAKSLEIAGRRLNGVYMAVAGLCCLAAAVLLAVGAPFNSSLLQEEAAPSAAYAEVNGTFVAAAATTSEKVISQRFALPSGTAYGWAFEAAVSSTAPLTVEVIDESVNLPIDHGVFTAPGDSGFVTFSRTLPPEASPAAAVLRISSRAAAKIAVRGIRVWATPRWARVLPLLLMLIGFAALTPACIGFARYARAALQAIRNCPSMISLCQGYGGVIALVALTATYLNFRHLFYDHPFAFGDEGIYAMLVKFGGKQILLNGHAYIGSFPNTLYFAAYRWVFQCGDAFLQAARAQNVVFHCLAFLPAYAVLRRMISPGLAVFAVLAIIAAPLGIYTALFMPESLYFLLFSVLVWMLVNHVTERPLAIAPLSGLVFGCLVLVKPHALILAVPVALTFAFVKAAWKPVFSWRRCALFTGLFLCSAAAAVFGLNLFLTGTSALGLGGTYSGLVRESSRPAGIGALFRVVASHLGAVSTAYALPLVVIAFSLVGPAGTADPSRLRLRVLAYLTGMCFLILLVTTSNFTLSVAGRGPLEVATRIHARYYTFLLPWCVVCFFAASPHFDSWLRRPLFYVPAMVAALGGIYWTLFDTKKHLMFFPDFPDVYWIHESGAVARLCVAAGIAVLTAASLLRRKWAAWLFGWGFLAFSFTGTFWLSRFLASIPASPVDTASEVFKRVIGSDVLEQGVLVGSGSELYRFAFHLRAAPDGVIDPQQIVSAVQLGSERPWAVVCGNRVLKAQFAERVDVEGCSLYIQPQAVAPFVRFGAPGLRSGRTANMRRADGPPRCSIDQIGDGQPLPAGGSPVRLSAGAALSISGWAIDEKGGSLAAGVEIAVDGTPYTATYGVQRPDVASFFERPEYTRSGFSLTVPAEALKGPSHSVTVRVISRAAGVYWETAPASIVIK